MAEDLRDDVYAPTWLYHKDGRSHMALSIDEEMTLRKDPSWAESPAMHGAITAPSAEQLAQMPHVFAPETVGTGSSAHDQQAFSHLLMQWQRKLDTAEQQGQFLQHQLAETRDSHDAALVALEALQQRVHTLEQWVVKMEAPADKNPPAPRERAR